MMVITPDIQEQQNYATTELMIVMDTQIHMTLIVVTVGL